MAGITGNAAIMTCILVMLTAVSLRWVSGGDANVDTGGVNADDVTGAVGSRSVGADTPQDPPPCASEPCKFSGECVADGPSYVCHCTAGHVGKQCGDADPCWSSPCLNQGKCIPLEMDYKCNCQPGCTGKQCENGNLTKVECTKTYCENGGACKIKNDGLLSCVCTPGWFGQHCQLAAGNGTGTNHTTNDVNNASDAFPLRRRQHGRSIYDVLMLDVAIIGLMSVVFSLFMCVCVTCEWGARQPGDDEKERDEEQGGGFFGGWFLKRRGTEQTKLLKKKP